LQNSGAFNDEGASPILDELSDTVVAMRGEPTVWFMSSSTIKVMEHVEDIAFRDPFGL
jgi:hypothetical protein